MPLAEYRRKRRFSRTPEPAGKARRRNGNTFVVQKHDASRLHYDFRLEMDGVLKSWAVPKGPSLNPRDKRLAVQVEDHPVDYGGFEGIIPEGEYGGGTVMLWDRGHWRPVDDPQTGYRQGKLKFHLDGEKLHGGWVLVKQHGGQAKDAKNWFLIKVRDDQARDDGAAIVESAPLSVATGRDLDEIEADRDEVWDPHKKAVKSTAETKNHLARPSNGRAQPATKRRLAKKPRDLQAADIPAARRRAMPSKIDPQLATLVDSAPAGDNWLHELKFDGYRMLCRLNDGRVKFVSRNQQDWTARLGRLARTLERLPARQVILDGEVVAVQPDGTTNFQALQNAQREGRSDALSYYVFDLLYLDGSDLRPAPLAERKAALAKLLAALDDPAVRFSEDIAGDGPAVFESACRASLEGIICKRRDQPYSSGRGRDWLKVKCGHREEFVVGGYTEPGGSRAGFGALLLGYYDPAGELQFCGKVGTGFSAKSLSELIDRLTPLARDSSPFANLRTRIGGARRAHWVEPKLVAQIAFSNWTRDQNLRHPSFEGLREDKRAQDVVRDQPEETPMTAPAPEKTTRKKSARKSSKKSLANKKAGGMKRRRSSTPSDGGPGEVSGVVLSHPDKVLYPDQGITKQELAEYYEQVSPFMLPHVADRPLVLVRCPQGQQKPCFFQKHLGHELPETLRQVPVTEKSKRDYYLVLDDAPGLVSLVQMGALEIHVWGSRADDIERPDRLIFDLDPAEDVAWPRVVESARQIRRFLQDLGLETFIKTTGGKGLHLVAPVQRRHDWDQTKAFCRAVAEAIVRGDPEHYTSNMSKRARGGKIFVDYLRNARGATAVAAYSTRNRPGAPVSTPLSWDELSSRIKADHFNVRNLAQRLSTLKQDPWGELLALRQSITAAAQRTLGLTGSKG